MLGQRQQRFDDLWTEWKRCVAVEQEQPLGV
jgi:hypothetical protein